jgi:hypothetical protein
LRRILYPKGDELENGWRKLCIEKIRVLQNSPNTAMMLKCRRLKLQVYVTRIVSTVLSAVIPFTKSDDGDEESLSNMAP